MRKILIFIIIILIKPISSFSQDAAWWLKVDRDTNTKRYDKHDVITQNNQIVLDFSDLAKNRTPLKIKLKENEIPKYSFSFFTRIKAQKDCHQNSIIASNKAEDTSDGWEIRANELGGWEWNYSLNQKIIANYKTTSEKYAINDGDFHLVGFTYDYTKNQVWIYFDGEHIGIINIHKADLSNFDTLYIGGVGNNERTSFNGYFKSMYLFKEFIGISRVKQLYSKNPRYLASIGVNGTFYNKIKVLTWNIDNGGITHGDIVGLKRTLKLLKQSKADIIALQESRGAVEYLAEGLGFYFYKVNDNIAILTRYPIKQTLKIFESKVLGAVEISISKQQTLYFFNVSLDNTYDWADFNNSYSNKDYRNREQKSRADEVDEIMKQIKALIHPNTKTSLILTGEMNSISAIDDGGSYENYPVSRTINSYGFKDSYRELYPNRRIYNGYTRNTYSEDKRQGRVDSLFYKGSKLQVAKSELLKKHPIKFPSSNFGVITEFIWKK